MKVCGDAFDGPPDNSGGIETGANLDDHGVPALVSGVVEPVIEGVELGLKVIIDVPGARKNVKRHRAAAVRTDRDCFL